MRLHVFPPSPRAFKVLVVAHHLGIDYQLALCDLTKGEQKSAAYAALNPNQRMPTLEDGDFKLWESNAIIQYLATKKPGSGLLPADERGRADIARWQFWESTTWDPACAILVYERAIKRFFGGGAPDPVEVEKGLQRFHRAAKVLDGHLRGRTYVCGNRLTIADFAIGADLTMAEPAQLPLEGYGEIRRWGEMLAELPAWQRTRAMQSAGR
ncbi:MAG: glutathione S-transferase family protein [Betaproteobacteria bacterium]|nr:MAG: glutathione S-transferase family protein [Betaproteobacteria bacterium]